MFRPHINKVKSAFYETRRSVKNRILTETNVNKQWYNETNANENETSALINIAQEDDNNIFDLLQNLWINKLRFDLLC